MNYLTEIKLFYDWLEAHPLTPAAISLWHGLMFIANRMGWEEEFTIPLSVLEVRTGMSAATLYRIRIQLKDAGHLWFVYMMVGLYLLMPLLSPWAEKVGRKELGLYIGIWLFTTLLPFFRAWLRDLLGLGADGLLGIWTTPVQILVTALLSFCIVAICCILLRKIPKLGTRIIG